METNEKETHPKPPGVINAIVSGFNITASHVWLIAIPVLIDVFLWLGTRVRIFVLLGDTINRAMIQSAGTIPESLSVQVKQSYDLIQEILKGFNVLSFITTFPVGVPSLLAGSIPMLTPLGIPEGYEIDSYLSLCALVLILIMAGFFIGCVYLLLVAHFSSEEKKSIDIKAGLNKIINLLLMTIALFVFLFIAMIPFSCVSSILMLISPTLMSIAAVVMLLCFAWVIIPLFFVPHGILSKNLNLIDSLAQSIRLAKFFAPSTSFYIVTMVILNQGLNMIWTIPAFDSWMLLIGIFGHAFISTGMISAGLILYQNDLKWEAENKDFIQSIKRRPFISIKVEKKSTDDQNDKPQS